MTVHKVYPLKQQNCKGLQIVVAGKTDTINVLVTDCYNYARLWPPSGSRIRNLFGSQYLQREGT